jgi:FAD dependent oxidoreductase.
MKFDKIVIGAGLYGLYAAEFSGSRYESILVLEYETEAFTRATYINQARVHMGYHYPRSFSTAIKSAGYFNRFMDDYKFCVLTEFEQVYATSANYSWTNAEQFRQFCYSAEIMCDDISPTKYFNKGLCDGAFLTKEYTYDAHILKKYFLDKIEKYKNIKIEYGVRIKSISKYEDHYEVELEDNRKFETSFLLNATYASSNQIINRLELEPFNIKYELCEIILCKVSEKLRDVGLTVMDGPFFSIMPFGKTGYHSLTSVTFTPHVTSISALPEFKCQKKSKSGACSPLQIANCNNCDSKPDSAWQYMSNMARKYIKSEYKFEYVKSLYSVKPILRASEIDDSRPTVVRKQTENPTFVSVLSGKINTVYDLDEVLING